DGGGPEGGPERPGEGAIRDASHTTAPLPLSPRRSTMYRQVEISASRDADPFQPVREARVRPRFLRLTISVCVLGLAGVTLASSSPSPPASIDARVTNDADSGGYRRYDGAVDAVTQACSAGRRQQNEPTVAVDPRDPNVIVAG